MVLILSVYNKNDIVVFAQATSIPAQPMVPLTVSEKAKLNQGEIILKGEKGNYVGQIMTTGNIDTA
ncbi:MAG: hypothetical protein AAGE84_06505 [Cyanobacteria bacterium P01_G01_bin.39]